jgi:hypothetical protein
MKSGSMGINTRVRGTYAPEDAARRVARRAYGEWLGSQSLKRHVEGDSELACSWVTGAEMPLLDASTLADQITLHPL